MFNSIFHLVEALFTGPVCLVIWFQCLAYCSTHEKFQKIELLCISRKINTSYIVKKIKCVYYLEKISEELMLVTIIITNYMKIETVHTCFCKVCSIHKNIQVCNRPIKIILSAARMVLL